MDALNTDSVFHIHIQLPEVFSHRFSARIPSQRMRVNQLLEEKIILSYSLDMERNNVWVVMRGKNQKEIMDILSTFPIIRDVKLDIHELAFYDTANNGLPELIMN